MTALPWRIFLDRWRFPTLEAAQAAMHENVKDARPLLLAAGVRGWLFEVRPVGLVHGWRDENVAAELARSFGTKPERAHLCRLDLPTASGRMQLAVDHCWALEAWSRWLAESRSPDRPVTLVHFDAHDDLSAPALAVTASPEIFRTPLGEAMDIRNPASVADAIAAGFVGIGGFVVPMLHAIPTLRYIHVMPQSEGRAPTTHEAKLALERRPSRSIADGPCEVPAVRRDRTGGDGRHALFTDDIEAVLDAAPAGDVLLDFDLDYFCNALDDSTDAPDTRTLAESLDNLDRLEKILFEADWRDRVAVITIATSPGFLPSSWWSELVPRMSDLGARLLQSTPPPGTA